MSSRSSSGSFWGVKTAEANGSMTLRSNNARLAVAVFALMLVGVAVWVALTPSSADEQAAGIGVSAVVVLGSLIFGYRGWTARLAVSPEGVTIRNIWRTRRLRWPDIEKVAWARVRSDRTVRHEAVSFYLYGRPLPVQSTVTWWPPNLKDLARRNAYALPLAELLRSHGVPCELERLSDGR